MFENPGATIAEHFSSLEDPRMDRTKLHPLENIIVIALCAVICGADSWVDMELFGESKRQWFAKFLDLSNGIPSHDTFGRVSALLNAEQFQRSFAKLPGIFVQTGAMVWASDSCYGVCRTADWQPQREGNTILNFQPAQ